MKGANHAISPAWTFHLFCSWNCCCVYGKQCKLSVLKQKTQLKYQADKSQYKEIMLNLFKNSLNNFI